MINNPTKQAKIQKRKCILGGGGSCCLVSTVGTGEVITLLGKEAASFAADCCKPIHVKQYTSKQQHCSKSQINSQKYLLFPPFKYLHMAFFDIMHQMVSRMSRAQLISDLWILIQPIRDIFRFNRLILIQRL